MKKLFVSVLTAISLSFLICGVGLSQYTHPPNTVGLFTMPDGSGDNHSIDVGTPITVYLVLIKPTDEQNGDTPYTIITGFECQLNFIPVGNLFKLGETFPPNYEPVGDNNNIGLGYLEYIVGMYPGYPVTNESVVLISIIFMHTAPGNIEVTLGPINISGPPSITGEMAFQEIPGDLRAMYPYTNPYIGFQFLFGEPGLALESETFGSVKALYR